MDHGLDSTLEGSAPAEAEAAAAAAGKAAEAKQRNDRLMTWATRAAVATALTLIGIKIAAWTATQSVSLLSSLMDSLLDGAASVVTLLAVRQALQPADEDHRFGHGKAEPLAGLAQAGFITGSGLFLVIEAVNRLIHPTPVVRTELGIAVILFSIVLTLCLVLFQRHVVKKTGSLAIEADSLHYRGDLFMNAGVIMALVLSGYLGFVYADPLIAMLIAAYIVHGAYGIGKIAVDQLMDKELPEAERQRVAEVAMAVAGVLDLHEMRTRTSGRDIFIQLHIELDREMSLLEAHRISETVEARIEKAFPGSEVIVHQDPKGVSERRRPL
ncbi:MAG: cation diffusion facilitator family transporter [Magnetovibrionaceae bacterium]